MNYFKSFTKYILSGGSNKFLLCCFTKQQDEAIKSIVDGNDTLVLLPTGAGKSWIYQLLLLVLLIEWITKFKFTKFNKLQIKVSRKPYYTCNISTKCCDRWSGIINRKSWWQGSAKRLKLPPHFGNCDFSQFLKKHYSNVINNWWKQITVLERGIFCDYFDIWVVV